MITTKELIKKLPGSWSELKLKDYQKLMDVKVTEHDDLNVFVGVDNTLKVISVLTDTPVEQLEDLPYYEVAALAERLTFLQTLPTKKKGFKVKLKKVEEITYDEFLTFKNHLEQPTTDVRPLFKMMVKDKDFSDEQIDNLDMEEVLAGFFLLKKHWKKSINNSIWSTSKQLMIQGTKNLMNRLQHFKPKTGK